MNNLSQALRKVPKKRLGLFLLIFFVSFFLGRGMESFGASDYSGASGAVKPTKTVAILYDRDHPYVRNMVQSMRNEMVLLAGGYYNLKMLPDQSAEGDAAKAADFFKKNLEDPRIDLIIVAGPLFIEQVKQNLPLAKPVIIASLLNPAMTGLPQSSEGTSGEPNLYYTAKSSHIDDDLRLFHRIAKFYTTHVLIDDGLRAHAEGAIAQLRDKGVGIELISGTGSVSQILEQIDQVKPEALYLTPLNLTEEEHQSLIDEINQRAIPTFSYIGREEVEMGVLASRMPKLAMQFSRRIAITADRILKGEEAATIPVRLDIEQKLVVNQKTANQIGLSLPFDILLEAEVLFRGEVVGEKLTMWQAVSTALENNLNFKVFDEKIKAVGKDYWLVWTNYLPLAEARLAYDRADFSESRYGNSKPTMNYETGVTLNQLIFSHPVLRQISNAKKQISIEKMNKDTAVLDITNQTISAYLRYLRAKALLKVEQERLNAVTENLAVANRRYQTGLGGKEEVLRWEAELSDEKSLVLSRDSAVFQARVVLNQLMNRGQEEVFVEQDVGLETLKYYIGGQTVNPYVNNLGTMRVFLDFSVEQALRNSPEVKALDLGIEQQKNNIKTADGRYIFPEVTMSGDAYKVMDEEYNGGDPDGDGDGWAIGVKMTYPLFDRGRRPIDARKQRDILHQLEYSLYLKNQEIERDLRLAAYDIYTLLPSIELKRQAMISSAEEYEIMKLKYQEGLTSYVDLANAQAQKFQREANAVIAIYDFFDALASFDRQVAKFNMLASEQERESWLGMAREYMKEKGADFIR